MPEQSKPYSPEEAWNEAELIKQKKAANEKLSYADAEKKVEFDKIKENAGNGTYARVLRGLDLTNSNDIEEATKILSSCGGGPNGAKIFDASGSRIFSIPNFEDKAGSILNTFKGDYFEKLKNANIFTKTDKYGHEITTATWRYLDLAGMEGQDIGKITSRTEESEKLFGLIGVMSFFTAKSLNGTLCSRYLNQWREFIEEGELSEDIVKKHPNFKSIEFLVNKADKFFETLHEFFLKYLSNQIQDPNFLMSSSNSNINIEEIYSDFEKVRFLLLSIKKRFRDERLRKVYEGDETRNGENFEEVEAETQLYIGLIDKYQKAIEEYSKKIRYAKPEVKN